jgi:hypothetical protein
MRILVDGLEGLWMLVYSCRMEPVGLNYCGWFIDVGLRMWRVRPLTWLFWELCVVGLGERWGVYLEVVCSRVGFGKIRYHPTFFRSSAIRVYIRYLH